MDFHRSQHHLHGPVRAAIDVNGFTPLEAIAAATGISAKVLGIDREVGTLERGKFADIVAVDGRPDQDIEALFNVRFVMVGGKDLSSLSFR